MRDFKGWRLLEKKSLEQIEKEHTYQNSQFPEPTLFGYGKDQWLKFKKLIQDGDELWEVDNNHPPLAGRWGIGIVRDGQIVNFYCTAMS